MRFLHVHLTVGLLFAAGNAFGQSDFFLLIRDYSIGAGSSFMTANAADFSVSGSPSAIKVSGFGFDCYFAGPNGSNLTVGVYSNSIHYPSNGGSPGMTLVSHTNNFYCNTDCGGFQIKELHSDTNGQVDRLWVTFSNQCNCSFYNGGQIRGEIRFNSQLADQAVLYFTCPSNIVVDAPYEQNSTVVTYPSPDFTPGAWVDLNPPSGSSFSAGTNIVVANFLYGTNSTTCSFTVTVHVAPFVAITLFQIQAQWETALPFRPGTLAIIHAPGNVELVASAQTDAFESISSITFVSSTNIIGVSFPLPSFPGGATTLYPWLNISPGYYPLQAIVQNSSGLLATSAVLNVTVRTNLIQNGGFETGDFRSWTLVGTPSNTSGDYNGVYAPSTGVLVNHSGYYGAALGDIKVASLSQTIPTVPGQYYLLSLWLVNPVSGTNQLFRVNWNTATTGSNTLLSIISPPVFSWTKLESIVVAAATNVTLQIQAENDPSYFGLDDISVIPIPPPTLQGVQTLSNNLQLSWLTAPGVAYQVEYKTNLSQTSWSSLIPSFVATSSNSTLLDANSPGSSQRFYRLTLP